MSNFTGTPKLPNQPQAPGKPRALTGEEIIKELEQLAEAYGAELLEGAHEQLSVIAAQTLANMLISGPTAEAFTAYHKVCAELKVTFEQLETVLETVEPTDEKKE